MNDVITNQPEKCREALAALHHVMDPEIGLNIVDLGLLYQLDFDEAEKKIYLSMTLTTAFCPMGDSIRKNTVNALQQAFPDWGIHPELVFDPPWNAGRISEQGRKFLNQ